MLTSGSPTSRLPSPPAKPVASWAVSPRWLPSPLNPAQTPPSCPQFSGKPRPTLKTSTQGQGVRPWGHRVSEVKAAGIREVPSALLIFLHPQVGVVPGRGARLGHWPWPSHCGEAGRGLARGNVQRQGLWSPQPHNYPRVNPQSQPGCPASGAGPRSRAQQHPPSTPGLPLRPCLGGWAKDACSPTEGHVGTGGTLGTQVLQSPSHRCLNRGQFLQLFL